ncbi:VWA domain-containing protein [Deinococcus sp. AJ005]|uniref:vWA domain-containing protein n=1 Tax=Deinococcus sp. AJ005 TaxID=2652443 RepID=UPI00125CBC0A|nr:VWA domain-containing protein [Deinococcus sp. AJ005]QFP75079.1 VWA domain-containing protein [Deinococcus sp. AJ005]
MATSASGASEGDARGFHPAQSLPDNLRAFCKVLRREHDFVLGPGELADALWALEWLGLADPERLRLGLRLILCARQQDLEPFDDAFTAFFFPVTDGLPQPLQPPTEPPQPRHTSDQPAPEGRDEADPPTGPQDTDDQEEQEFDVPAARRMPHSDDPDAQLSEQTLRTLFSAQHGQAESPTVRSTEVDAMLSAATEFLAHLRLGTSRTWRPQIRGRRFDLRRTLRASLGTGGEAISPRWLARRKHHPRVALLLDGSRSMDALNAPALQFASALCQRSQRVEVFTFSTELREITADLRALVSGSRRSRGQAAGLDLKLLSLGLAWGGGTRIGDCLHIFLREHGSRVLGPHTLVIIASDGLDVGEPEVLAHAVQELARRSRGVLWLNPLAALPGYTPTARGIRAALPHLIGLTHAATPQEFARLTRRLR